MASVSSHEDDDDDDESSHEGDDDDEDECQSPEGGSEDLGDTFAIFSTKIIKATTTVGCTHVVSEN